MDQGSAILTCVADYSNGIKTVTTTPQVIVSVGQSNGGILVQNQGSVPVYLGGPTVTADQSATGGVQIAANTTTLIPSLGGYGHNLWGVVASGTASVAWLQPAQGA